MDYFSGANYVTVGGVRQFVDLNLSTNTPGSFPNADWFNGVQNEIINLITGTGQTPSDSNQTQLETAVKILANHRAVTAKSATGVYPGAGYNASASVSFVAPSNGLVVAIAKNNFGGLASALVSGALTLTNASPDADNSLSSQIFMTAGTVTSGTTVTGTMTVTTTSDPVMHMTYGVTLFFLPNN